MKVFISYSHTEKDWVWDRLEACLKAGGAAVLIDRQQFIAGPAVIGQMDAAQDQAERHVLVLSREYLKSSSCQHEMKRAIMLDPKFTQQLVIPVRRDSTPLPPVIRKPNALYVDLRDDSRADQWELLLSACQASLGTGAPSWLAARDEVVRLLLQGQSVNLVTKGKVRWPGLINDLSAPTLPTASFR